MSDNTLLIRPEARLIRSIGADLIKDYYAAVIELNPLINPK